ncbi:PAS domain-containing sensor histidine kinase [Lutibacter sp. B1]|uniref:PAS domain-containing sensor histidine kinase n=1 Tax=Lutibacter sp. B1 TaxID=2725996 RepID=UPI001457818D|nr:PAS domain-containing sensor histidine kinase [Lutibacter sp. B1]NLP59184.1 PAS domain S-box protein [Lutibacter sp. B1]
MSQKEFEILKRALERERTARKQAEKILEDKSKELYLITEKLKETNIKLERLLTEKASKLKGVFDNLADAYVLMDLKGNVINMNKPAIDLFGYNLKEELLNVVDIIYKDDYKYTMNSYKKLLNEGKFTDYVARICTKNNDIRLVHINSSLVYNVSQDVIGAQGIVRDITEETAIKELLEEQKHQLNIIIDNSPIGISLSRMNNKGLLLVNKALCKMLGYSEEELKEIQIQDLTHPDDREISKLKRDDLFRGKIDSFNLEKRYIKKNGETLWAKTRVTAVRNSKAEIKFQVATIEDITNEKLANEKLKESEERLATLILNLDSGIFLEDENNIAVLANKKVCELFYLQISPEEVIGKDFSNVAEEFKDHFENPEEFVARYNTIIKNREIVIGDELRMADGKILERNYIPIFKDKVFKGHLWSFNDVTLRRKYRKSLESQKQKYSNIIANMNLGLIEVDNDDNILMVNQSFTKMTGYSEEELIGKRGRDILPVEEDKKLIKLKGKEREKGKSDSFELRIINKKGEIRYWLVSGAPNYNINGQILGSIGINLDITDLKSLELQKEDLLKKLEKSNEELQEYAHIVSHDLKSPLRSIYALVSWLKEDNYEKFDENSLNNLSLIEGTLEKMEHLISDILSYSSVTPETFQKQNVDVNVVIEDIKNIVHVPNHISLKVLNNLPVIKGDKIRIQQLFQNLISNSIRYIDKENGLIEIDVVDQKSFFKFSVKDNGIGIKKEYHNKIFKIFHSLNLSKDSTGIGLSIVKKIVDMYKGEIWLESEVGKGTTFYFTLKKD